jgi:hypothetical protein
MRALGREQQYPIKSTTDGHERLALESQLGLSEQGGAVARAVAQDARGEARGC